jgi:pimeloyl-ACP methyl ester carboxylesterase
VIPWLLHARIRSLNSTPPPPPHASPPSPKKGCLSLPVNPELLAALRAETLRCDGAALAELMRDHTQLDWRTLLPRITLPCLNLVGGRSGVFPVEGCLEVANLIEDCRSVVFDRANHWLYLEQPDEFNRLVLEFVASGNAGKEEQKAGALEHVE